MVSGSIYVYATLTLLPGTVVKLDSNAGITVIVPTGQLVSLGTPRQHVTVTSIRDDSVLGDTNGDGTATSPARGDWQIIHVAGWAPGTQPANYTSPTSVLDYTDVRYGGGPYDVFGCRSAAVYAYDYGVRLIVSNSSFSDIVNAGVYAAPKSWPSTFVGVYNSTFTRSTCGIGEWDGYAPVEVVGNSFVGPFDDYPIRAVGDHLNLRVWFNTIQGPVRVEGLSTYPPRARVDVRYNALFGGMANPPNYGLQDWSDNWFGQDANQALPACLDATRANNYNPPLTAAPSSSCPSGQVKPTGYRHAVLPALSASMQVLPLSVREAAAPRWGPVDTYSGALLYTEDDLTVRDAGRDIAFSHAYRSDRPGAGDAGTGWSTSYSESIQGAAMTEQEWDPEDVLLVIDHPFGKVEKTLAEWMAVGPGPRAFVRPVAARSRRTGEALPITVVPLAYRNDETARALIEAGELESPWSSPKRGSG